MSEIREIANFRSHDHVNINIRVGQTDEGGDSVTNTDSTNQKFIFEGPYHLLENMSVMELMSRSFPEREV